MAIGDVNRAKLYYLRGRVGKRARIREIRQDRTKAAPVRAVPQEPVAEPEPAQPEEAVEPEVEQAAEAEAPAEVGAEK
jgi:large subunit ribosomal protein L19